MERGWSLGVFYQKMQTLSRGCDSVYLYRDISFFSGDYTDLGGKGGGMGNTIARVGAMLLREIDANLLESF